MFFELIAAIVAGIAGAGVVMLLRRWSFGAWLPRWAIPAVAGAAMIGVGVHSEYAWFDRQSAALAENGVIVVEADAVPTALRPWTYAAPFVDRFVAVDAAGAQTHAAQPDLRLVRLLFFRRYYPTREREALVDCAGERLGDLTAASLSEDGVFSGVAWSDLTPDDGYREIIDATCEGPQPPAAS